MTEIGARLLRELGTEHVVEPSAPGFAAFGHDEGHTRRYTPDAVVVCSHVDQVRATLRIAEETGTPVTPRGAGSGKVGGCIPVRGGIVLSTEGMTGIIDIDDRSRFAIVEPGVVTGLFQHAVAELGLYYPPDPASLDFCSLGGNIATNAGGPKAIRYGVTADYVLGVDVCLFGGQSLSFGRRTPKGVSGYDLTGAFVGSEGTLGVITQAILKLIPEPPATATALACFESTDSAVSAVAQVLRSRIHPTALELLDEAAVAAVREHTPLPITRGAAVLIEIDGAPEGLEAALESVSTACDKAALVTEFLVARTPREQLQLWQSRRNVSPALKAAFPNKVSEDICVPPGRIADAVHAMREIGARAGWGVACYGHAGDGNLHVNLLIDEPADDDMRGRIEDTVAAMFRATVELGGTLSGEHGIGVAKRAYMPLEHSTAALDWQRRLKAMWDPAGLMNPDKVLPPT